MGPDRCRGPVERRRRGHLGVPLRDHPRGRPRLSPRRACSRRRFVLASHPDSVRQMESTAAMHGGASRIEGQTEFERLARRIGLEERDLPVVLHVPLFAGLETSSLAELLADAVVRRFPRNALLFVEGEPAGQVYLVLDGWVRLYRQTPDGRETVIALPARGETFAEAVMFLGGRYPVNAAVVDDARLLVIPAKSFRRALENDNELCFKMMASMAVHLR